MEASGAESFFDRQGTRKQDGALLAGADAARFPQVDIPTSCGEKNPKFTGGFDAFVAATPAVEHQAYNLIKKCANCGKPCAVTMEACNACGTSLAEVAVSRSPNLFVSFIFGIDKTSFPLRISMRGESPTMMVFDDPLAITRAHVLATPTNYYVPDIRALFLAPAEGLALVKAMEDAAWAALAAGPLASEAWRSKALSAAGLEMPVEDLRKHVVGAFNLPPSQYQLHLQYMLPPLLPNHVGIFRKGAHFVKGRHFPFAYVVAALEAFVAAGDALPNANEMDAAALIDAIATRGVSYDTAHAADMGRLEASNLLLGNFDPADFSYVVLDGKVLGKTTDEVQEGAPSAKELENADKLALQGYGRPYEEGKPGGVYYSFAREPGALPVLG